MAEIGLYHAVQIQILPKHWATATNMLFRAGLILLAAVQGSRALLEEPFVAFEQSDNSVALHDATIIHDAQDAEAVKIAVRSVAGDWEDITGSKAATCRWAGNATNACSAETAIIVGTVGSALIEELGDKADVSDVEGKWETFKTFVVSDPLPGVGDALVIAGSDKRGAAFGLYTLAEQSGQSPLVIFPSKRQ